MLELNLKNGVLHAGSSDPLVDAGADAKEGDTCRTDGHGDLRVDIALEGRQRTVGLRDVHRLHNQQIVVE